MKHAVLTLLAAFCLTATCALAMEPTMTKTDPENTLYMDLKDGRVVIQLRPDLAPQHVARIRELTRQKFYDGLVFHRVIEGFMAQGGDPTGTGTGGSGQRLKAEFSSEPFTRGTLGMARASDPDSADSQFFITFAETPHLNGQYTVFGQVVQGMEFVDKIVRGEPPANPDRLVKLLVAADVDAKPAETAPAPAATPAAEAKPAEKAADKPAEEKPAEKPAETPAAAPAAETKP